MWSQSLCAPVCVCLSNALGVTMSPPPLLQRFIKPEGRGATLICGCVISLLAIISLWYCDPGAAVDDVQTNVHRWVPIWSTSHSVLFSALRHLDIYFAVCSSYKYLEWFKPLAQREDKLQQTNGILEASRLLLYFVAKPHCINCKG